MRPRPTVPANPAESTTEPRCGDVSMAIGPSCCIAGHASRMCGVMASVLTCVAAISRRLQGPRPPPPPEPGCPGGSLEGCTALFPLSPPSAYRDCLEACLARCSNGPSPNPTPPPPPPPNPSPNPPPTPPGPGPAPGPCPSGSLVRNHPLLFILILFFPSSSYFRCVASVREEHPSTKGKRRRAPTARSSCGRPQQYPSHARTRSCPDTPPKKQQKNHPHHDARHRRHRA